MMSCTAHAHPPPPPAPISSLAQFLPPPIPPPPKKNRFPRVPRHTGPSPSSPLPPPDPRHTHPHPPRPPLSPRGPAPTTRYSVEQLWEFYRKAQSVTEYHTGTPLKFLRSGSIPLICRDSPETTYRVEVDHGTLDSDGTVTLWEALDGPNPPRSLVVRFLKHTSPEFL